MSRISRPAAWALALALLPCAVAYAVRFPGTATEEHNAARCLVSGKAHYASRDGLRIYLWEKFLAGSQDSFARSGKVALLVHGGTWSGRPDFDLQIRDYSLMDMFAMNGYDVWAIDIHGYGHSDKTDKDWSGVQSAAADIGAAVEYVTKLRGVSKVDLLGWSAGTQRAGMYVMQHPERVARLILYAPVWNATPEYREQVRKKIENGENLLGSTGSTPRQPLVVILWRARWRMICSSRRTLSRSMRKRHWQSILSRRMRSSTMRIFRFWIHIGSRSPP